MKNFYLLLVTLCALQLKAQTWIAHTPPFGDTIGISDVHVVNENVIWAVGVRFGVDDSLYYFGVGNIAYYAVTANGGSTWKVGTIPFDGAPFIGNMTATDAGTAMVIGLENFGNAKTLKTTDGGDTWEITPNNWDPVVSWPDYICSISPAKYCVIGDPRDGEFEIYTTGNAGQVWQRVSGANIPDPLPGEFGYNNFGDHIGNVIWFGTNRGRVYRSDNSGLSWTAYPTPLNDDIGGLTFSDANHGVVVTGYGFGATAQMYRTSNGGATWEAVSNLPHDGAFKTFGTPAYIPGQPYLLWGITTESNLTGNFETWISKNRGDSWQQISSGEIIGWPTFISPTVGWAGDFQQLSRSTRLYEYNGSPLLGLFSPEPIDAQVSIMPNPASDYVTVQVSAQSPSDFWVMLHDEQGKLLRKQTIQHAETFETSFQINDLPAGKYMLTISGAKGCTTETLVVHR